MYATLVVALLQQRLRSPMRLFLLAPLFGFPVLYAYVARTLEHLGGLAFFFALVLGAGAIGQDISSGVLQLTFARPVSRPSYVTSRWLAVTLAATGLAVLQLLACVAIVAARGGEPDLVAALVRVPEDLVLAGAGAALLVCFSSFVGGVGDVGVYAMLVFGTQGLSAIASFQQWRVTIAVLQEWNATLRPEVSLMWLAGRGSPEWTPLVTALSTTALCLAIAILVVNRRELSYASQQ